MQISDKRYFNFFILFVFFISIYRLSMLYIIDPNLFKDEAYYWIWSQNFDWGYYSKPPMIAWFISVAEYFFGDSGFVLKSISIFVYPITTTVIYLIAKELTKSDKVAFYASVLFITAPAVTLSSMIISTDVCLLLFWSLTIYFFILALKSDRWVHWILTGIFGGLGLLSKYNMILIVPSAVLYLIFSKKYKNILFSKKFYTTLFIAMLVFSPNLIWNYMNDFISFSHVEDISRIEKKLFHFDNFAIFLGSQFAVFGILSFALLVYAAFVIKRYKKDETFIFSYSFTFVFLLFFTFLAFLSRAIANWSAPTYVMASVLVAYLFIIKLNNTKLLKAAIALNIVVMVLFYHYEPIMKTFGVEITKKNDPYKRVRGWKRFAKEVDKVYKNLGGYIILGANREILSELIFYIKPHPFNAMIFNPNKTINNYFEQTQDLNDFKGRNFLFITSNKNDINKAKRYFQQTKFIKEIIIPIHKDFNRRFYLYDMRGFKGY